jgi:hypothetical protein
MIFALKAGMLSMLGFGHNRRKNKAIQFITLFFFHEILVLSDIIPFFAPKN